jgi:hypothetical protein
MSLKHTERNRRIETTGLGPCGFGLGGMDYSVVERYCEHCEQWVEVRGVTGELVWLGTHEDGDCKGAS